MPLAGKMNGANGGMSLVLALNTFSLRVCSLTVLEFTAHSSLSSAKISKSVDAAMDKSAQSNGTTKPGISIRNGPVTEDVDMGGVDGPAVNGAAKRKARPSASRPNYADSESSEDDNVPLVRLP